jgi:hypothetical protein
MSAWTCRSKVTTASPVQRESVPSTQMRWMSTANRRAAHRQKLGRRFSLWYLYNFCLNFCRGLNDRHAVFHMWIDEMDYPPWPVS